MAVLKLILLSGFAGSGKSSVLEQLARHIAGAAPVDEIKLAVLETPLGEGDLDTPVAGEPDLTVKGLFPGCLGCAIKGDPAVGLRELARTHNPSWLLLEAEGSALPDRIAGALRQCLPAREGTTTVTVVDARRWMVLSCMMTGLMEGQVSAADILLLNKTDLVDAGTLGGAKSELRKMNPAARLFEICAKEPVDPGVFDAILEGERPHV